MTTGTSGINPNGTFLRATPKRINVRPADKDSIEKLLRRRARGRERQSRYATSLDVRRDPATSLDVRRDPPAAKIGAALLQVVATAPPEQYRSIRPVIFALISTMRASGYDPRMVLRRVKLIRRRMRRSLTTDDINR